MTTKIPAELSSTPGIADSSNATAITIDSSERVGIGTTSPAVKLAVADSGGGNVATFTDTTSADLAINLSGGVSLITPSTGTLAFGTSSTERMRINSSGHLLVGTTSEYTGTSANLTVPLQIDISANDANLKTLAFGRNAAEGEIGGIAAKVTGMGTMGRINFVAEDVIGGQQASSIRFKTTATATEREVMRINSAGVVCIGTTSAGSSSSINCLSTPTNANVGVARFGATGEAAATTAMSVVKSVNDNSTSNVFVRFGINNYAGGSGQINANGSSQAAFGTFSDRRLKENITDLPSQLDKIKAMRPVEFDYIESEGGGHQLGFVAQEVEEIYSDMVGERHDGMKTLSGLGKWEARLVKAIQEQQTIIETQQTTINDLKSRIETLEG